MMRRLLPFGLLLLLPACDYVGNPFDGAGSFLGDTVSFRTNPNRPAGDAPNMRRVMGEQTTAEPLLPEPGNVWPGPLPPARTLSDLQRDPSLQLPGTSTMTPPTPTPMVPPLRVAPPPPNQPPGAAAPTSRVFQTPSGPVITSVGGNGIETFTMPSGKTGTVINNGNGTATLIGADGSSMIAPMPR